MQMSQDVDVTVEKLCIWTVSRVTGRVVVNSNYNLLKVALAHITTQELYSSELLNLITGHKVSKTSFKLGQTWRLKLSVIKVCYQKHV